jgi:hypothetical protein
MNANAITRAAVSVIAAAVGGLWNAAYLFIAIGLVTGSGGQPFIVLLPLAGLAAVGVGIVLARRHRSLTLLGWAGLASVLLILPWLWWGGLY